MDISRKHHGTLQAIFRRPVSGTIRWKDIEALFVALGAEIEEREGSRVAVIFPGQMPAVFHRPHPSPMADKGAIMSSANGSQAWAIRQRGNSNGNDGT